MQYSPPPKYPATPLDSGADSLPCLNSDISTENSPGLPPLEASGPQSGASLSPLPALGILTAQHRRTAFILSESVQQMASLHGLETLGFLTLTFREHVTDPREAQRRLNSLITHQIKPRYRDYLGVMERQKSSRIHYHLLVALGFDIRTGFDFEAVSRSDYKSANKRLRLEWSHWRKTAPAYGFGRTELMPIKSTTEAIARYVGKYISKHIDSRQIEDRGVRLVRYSQGVRAGTVRFQFHSPGSVEWRRKLAIFAQIVQDNNPQIPITQISDLGKVLGKRWAYHHREFILSLP